MAYQKPEYSKTEIDKAGKRIAEGQTSEKDYEILDNWRNAHAYVLNTFKANLRRNLKKFKNVTFVQRLKRRKTIIDKLQRKNKDGNPVIKNLSSMHDFAGCRLIFSDIEDLKRFREEFHTKIAMEKSKGVQSKHFLRHKPEKYDYIENPKDTGYRGIHDVLAHHPRPHRKGDTTNHAWHGLLVEIQYRTEIQNTWATAVELSDLIDNERTKFDSTENDRKNFFSIASEILAREKENMRRCFQEKSTEELRKEFDKLEAKTDILGRLALLKVFPIDPKAFGKHTVLNLVFNPEYKKNAPLLEKPFSLDVKKFKSRSDAIAAANKAESDENSINAVYIHAEDPNKLRTAYKNYFNDAGDFVKYLL